MHYCRAYRYVALEYHWYIQTFLQLKSHYSEYSKPRILIGRVLESSSAYKGEGIREVILGIGLILVGCEGNYAIVSMQRSKSIRIFIIIIYRSEVCSSLGTSQKL